MSFRLWAALAAVGLCVACTNSGNAPGAQACLAPLALDCQVAFEPTYPALYSNLFVKTCGSPSTGGSCHGPQGAKAGLVLSDMDQAYGLLLGTVGGRARVVPGDPECSLIEQRVESSDPNYRMPPGSAPLPESVRCALRQWIANGAARQ